MLAARQDDIFQRYSRFGQIVRQVSLRRQMEIGRQHRLADIHAHQHHFLTQHRQRQRDVTRNIRFTVSIDARCNENDRRGLLLRQHKPQVRSNQTEQLRRNGRFAFVDRYMRIARVLHYLPQHRCLDSALKLLRIVDLVIEKDIQIQRAGRQDQAQQDTQQQQFGQLRTLAAHVALRHIQDLRRHRGRRQHQGILLAFLI